MIKVVLDGALFSECEKAGANRDGMTRLAEDITDKLMLNKDLDISFANTVFMEKYDSLLKKNIGKKYPARIGKIISKKPPKLLNVFAFRRVFRNPLIKNFIHISYKAFENQDIFHSFYYPFSKPLMKNNKVKKSITFLDIIPLRLKGCSYDLVSWTKEIVASIESNYAISISEYSKQDLLDYDKRIKPENVFVAPLAADEKIFYPNKDVENWNYVKQKYKLPDNYFLSVSGKDKRKNIPHLVASFNKFLLQQKYRDIYLVLTGNTTHNYAMLNDLKISREVRDKIIMPNTFIDTNDMAALYSHAMCFFYMSYYEGFGLPALEAMQCGVPVVTSNATSLPEVVGNAGITLPPKDEDVLCDVMNKMYNSEALRNQYAEAGIARASTFSWQRCADEYAHIFKQIASN